MLTLDPLKRPTISQIKKHRWMKSDIYEKKFEYNPLALNNNLDLIEPHPQILRLMSNLGIEPMKICNVSYLID